MKSNIRWRPVVSHEGLYEVSNRGSVRSLDKVRESANLGGPYKRLWPGKVLSQQIDRYGYYYIGLTNHDGVRKIHKVHRLVAHAFIDNHLGKDQINHIDGIKTNNRVDNLQWCTGSENQRHSIEIGTHTLCGYVRDDKGRVTSIRKSGTG